MTVDIGSEAINRNTSFSNGQTIINKGNPSSSSSDVIGVDIWAASNITGLIVGTFYVTSGDTLKCRDSEAIAGTITAGGLVHKEVTVAVEIGDYIGCYYTGGEIEWSAPGSQNTWYRAGQYIDPNDEQEYWVSSATTISLGGYFRPMPVSNTINLKYNVRTLINDTVNYKWNVKTLVSDTLNYKWHIRALVNKTSQLKWHVKAFVSDTFQLVFNVRSLVSKTNQYIWNVRSLVNDTVNFKWDVYALASKTLQTVFNVRALVSKSNQLKWNVRKLVDKSLQSIWNVRKLVDKAIQFKWDVAELYYLVSNTLELQWYSLLRILKIESSFSRGLIITIAFSKGLAIDTALSRGLNIAHALEKK
ncbi:hypothetical protein LCGC14_1260070 [marine sediment metagenome]|uniref:Uncharacterized protein n=1 Tax=marine sediment metagenome TaxID=412755 RepID=A0A0F9L115_9ZZZZ